MTGDTTTDRYELEVPRPSNYSIERGGRLGLTLEHSRERETPASNVVMVGVGVAISAYSTLMFAGLIEIAGATAGGFIAGMAFERFQTLSDAEPIATSGDEEVDDE